MTAIIYLVLIAAAVTVVLSAQAVFGQNGASVAPTLSELERLRMQNLVLQVRQIDLQIDSLQKDRSGLATEINKQVDSLFQTYKIDNTKARFNLNTLQFEAVTPAK